MRFRTLGITTLLVSLLASPPALLVAQQQTARQATPVKPTPAVLDLNSATAAQFESLPGIGAKMAARIIDYRQKHGGFKKVEELMNVQGIGEKNFLKLKPYITVTPSKAERRNGAS